MAPRCAVQRLMRADGLQGVVRGRRRRTTIPADQASRPVDLVDRDFTATDPNRLWVADFTYVMTFSGVVYVAFVIDVFSRRIVGWKADTSMKTPLVLDTLEMALWARQHAGLPVAEGLIHHNDNGSQYLSFAFTSRLIDAGVDARSAVSATDTTTPSQKARSVYSRPRRSTAKDRGAPWPMSNSRRWNGSTGSITSGCIPPAAACPPPSLSKLTHNNKIKTNCLYRTRGGSRSR
jgi:putative transposase